MKPIPERVEEFKKNCISHTEVDAIRSRNRDTEGNRQVPTIMEEIVKRDERAVEWVENALTETDKQARASELELLAVHLDRQLAGYTNVSVDSVYRYIEQRKEAVSNPPSQV